MKKTRRESESGYSFLNLFQNCPYKFYLKYPMGLANFYTSPPLIEGGAFHEGKATWYGTGIMSKAMSTVKREIKSRKGDYQDSKNYERGYYRVQTMLTQWIMDWGELDLKQLKILEVEVQRKAVLPNGFYLTIRPDLVAIFKTGKEI